MEDEKELAYQPCFGPAQLISTTITSVLATTRCAQHASEFIKLSIRLIMTSIASALASLLGTGTWLFTHSKGRGRRIDLRKLLTNINNSGQSLNLMSPNLDEA
jgi:hypothetical protein